MDHLQTYLRLIAENENSTTTCTSKLVQLKPIDLQLCQSTQSLYNVIFLAIKYNIKIGVYQSWDFFKYSKDNFWDL